MAGTVEEAIAEAGSAVQLLWNSLASWRTVVLGVELGFAAA